jgi:hypothetical protein
MMLRLLSTGVVACLSAAGLAAALFVPDTDGNWPRAGSPFVDARSLQHDALAIGLAAAPGAPHPSADRVRFVVAPLAVPQFVWPPDRSRAGAGDRALVTRAGAGGISALVRVDGVTADVGDMLSAGRYRPAELAGDLHALPPLDAQALALARDAAAEAGPPPFAWATAPLLRVTLLLLALSLLLAGTLLARGRPARSR